MNESGEDRTVTIEGEISRRSSGRLLRFVLAVTGILTLAAAARFVLSYVLGLRRKGRIVTDGSMLRVETELFILGRRIRQSRSHVPFRSVQRISQDESAGVLPVLGAALGLVGGLAAGFIALVQWSMTLLGIYIIVGLACVLAGIALDILCSFVIPRARGRSSFTLATPTDVFTLTGVPREQIVRFMDRWTNAFVVKS